MFTRSCSFDHVIWTVHVGYGELKRKLSEIRKPSRKDIETMDKLLVWKSGTFMRPTFRYAPNGLSADQLFWDKDSRGIDFGDECEDPERLADLVQAKKNREFTIKQWVETHEMRDIYPIWPEEYLSHPGMDLKLFRTLFHRDPTPEIVESLSNFNSNPG